MIHCGAHGEHLSRYSICMRPLQLERGAHFPDIQLRDRMTTVDLEKRGKHSCLPMAVQSLTFKLNGIESEDPDSVPKGTRQSTVLLGMALVTAINVFVWLCLLNVLHYFLPGICGAAL